jgi:D-alanine-D-alanine ligase-like ATP-grasp enzyme
MTAQAFPEYTEKKPTCPYCGNSQVLHWAAFLIETGNVYTGRIYYWFAQFRLYRLIVVGMHWFFQYVMRIHYALSQIMGIITFSEDIAGAKSYRSRVIWEEAQRRRIPMQQLLVFKKHTEMYRAKLNGSWFYFQSLPVPWWLPQVDYSWMDDKYLLKKHCSERGCRMIFSESARTEAQAKRAFDASSGLVIVKPRIGSRGRHTVTRICTQEALIEAFHIAKQLCHFVVIEDFIDGAVCRATTVNGKLVGFLWGSQPAVIGDGVHTIAQLIIAQNSSRHERIGEIVVTKDTVLHLRQQQLTVSDVPAKGVRVELSLHTGRLFGGETEEFGNAIHPELKNEIEKVARVLAAPVIGFDLIISEHPFQPQKKWGIIEANTLPFIDLHYLPLRGTPTIVAKYIFDLWDDTVTP